MRELRTELTATASEVGMRQAVADLGHPRVLADAYLSELGRPVPRWTTGAVWGALAVGAVAYLAIAYAHRDARHDRRRWAAARSSGCSSARPPPSPTTTRRSSVASTFTWQVLVFYACVFTVPFLLGARVWRVWAGAPARARAAHA